MSSHNCRTRALLLAAALLLPALPARALPLDGAGVRDDRGVWAVLFDGIRSFWSGLIEPRGTAGVVMREGMTIDPSGRPSGSGTTSGEGDNGMLIDPHG